VFDNEKLELAGPIGVIAAVACAQAGAYALASAPASSVLWYLNLQLFRCFEYGLSGFANVPALDVSHLPALIGIALMALVGIALVGNVRLPLAVACNFSFLYSVCLLYGSYLANTPTWATNPNWSAFAAPSSLLAAALVLITLLSSASSHRRYWRAIRRDNTNAETTVARNHFRMARPAAPPKSVEYPINV
jgi:hypothetical protein